MADTNLHHGQREAVEQHPERHEQTDVSIKSLVLFLIIFATVLVGTMVGLVFLYTGFDSLADESRVPRSAVNAQPTVPAIPLQGIPGYHDSSPARDTESFIAAQNRLLATAGPTTQPGFVRIPVEDAMQILIDRKMLPSRSAGRYTMRSLFAFIVVLSIASLAIAQAIPPKQLMDQIGVDQKLDEQLPLELTFRDETGKTVRLGEYFGEKPVVLSLVYYECPMLCTMTLNGMLKTFKVLPFTIGQEYEVVTVSFDPRETPELAAKKKENYVKQYARENAGKGWHFLTGDADSIKKLCDAVGFRYTYDEPTKQFAHASAIMVLTPRGKLSRYFYGLEYVPKDLRLGLIEAADDKIGSPVDHVLLLCFQYDPKTGKYGFMVMTAVRVGAVLTVATIGAFMFVMFKRDRRRKTPSPGTPGEGRGEGSSDNGNNSPDRKEPSP